VYSLCVFYYNVLFCVADVADCPLQRLSAIVIKNIIIIIFYLGRSSRGGRQKLILEIITLMVNHASGSHQRTSRAAG